MNLPVSATSPGRLVTTPATSASGIGSKHGSVLTEAVGDQLLVAVHDAYLQVGRTVIERSITRANIVLTSATASVTAYTALLGLINSTTHGRRLPAIALWPVLYLGLAVALTAFYAGYLSPRFTRFHPLPVGASQDVAEARLTMFLTWAANATMSRAWALRMALVSLSLGLVLLPVGFISFHGALAVLVQVAPASVLFLCIGIEILRRHEPEPAAKPKPAIPIPIMPEPAMPVMPTPAMPMPAAREQPSRLLIETLTELHSSLMALASAQAESSLKYWELALESTRARLVALEDQLTRLSDDYLPGAANTRQVFQFKAICAEIQKSSREIMEIMESLSRPERTIEFTRRRLQDLKPIVLQLDELLDELLVTLKELADSG